MKRDESTRSKLITKIKDYNTNGMEGSNIFHFSLIYEYSIETPALHQRDEYLIYLDERFYFVTFDTNVDINGGTEVVLYEIINEERGIKIYFNTKDFDEEVWSEFTN